jgi:hypothetical protein
LSRAQRGIIGAALQIDGTRDALLIPSCALDELGLGFFAPVGCAAPHSAPFALPLDEAPYVSSHLPKEKAHRDVSEPKGQEKDECDDREGDDECHVLPSE